MSIPEIRTDMSVVDQQNAIYSGLNLSVIFKFFCSFPIFSFDYKLVGFY